MKGEYTKQERNTQDINHVQNKEGMERKNIEIDVLKEKNIQEREKERKSDGRL